MKLQHHPLFKINIAVILWGGSAMFAKGIDLPITQIICFRSIIACLFLFTYLYFTQGFPKLACRQHVWLILLLGVVICLHWLAYFKALRISSAAVAIVSLHTYPILTTLLEPILFKEKLKREDLFVALVVFGGVMLMVPEISFGNSTTQGIIWGAIAGLLFTVRNLTTRHYVQVYSGAELMFWQTLVSGVLLSPFLFIEPITMSMNTAGWMIVLGIVFTAIPQTLFSSSLQTLNTKTVSILATLLPFYGALFGYLIHDEIIDLKTALGGLLILACIFFETLKSMKHHLPVAAK